MIHDIQELPIRVEPADDEAFHGYVRRVCERLRCSPEHLLRCLAPTRRQAPALTRFGIAALPQTYDALAQLFNLGAPEVRDMFAEGSALLVDPITPEQLLTLDPLRRPSGLGETPQLLDLALCRTTRACPACTSVPGWTWKLEWQFRTVFACCEHECAISFAGEPERSLDASMISAQHRILQVASRESATAEGNARGEYLRIARCIIESAPLGHPNAATRVAWITTGLTLLDGRPMPPPASDLYRSWQAVLGRSAERAERLRAAQGAGQPDRLIIRTLIDHFTRRT